HTTPPHRGPPLFPYTTLFRSVDEPSSDARWPAILEVLVRHASRVLEAMTVQQAAGLSLPRPVARGSHTTVPGPVEHAGTGDEDADRKSTRLNSSHRTISYAVF